MPFLTGYWLKGFRPGMNRILKMCGMISQRFEHPSPQPRHPPSLLPGSLGMVSLLSIATMEILRLPLPPRAFALRSASGSSGRFHFLGDREPKARPRSRTLLCRCGPFRRFPWRQEALPASLETPSPLCPALRPRADLHARPSRRFGVAPAIPRTKAPPLISLSRLDHTASRLATYA